MHRVFGRDAPVDTVEDIFFVALVMEHAKLRRIQEPAGIQTINLDEGPPLLAAVAQVNRTGRGPKRPIRSGNAPRRSSHSLPRPRRYLNHQRRFATKLR